jgi:hypothetical protein
MKAYSIRKPNVRKLRNVYLFKVIWISNKGLTINGTGKYNS